jgi:hypothetical protein
VANKGLLLTALKPPVRFREEDPGDAGMQRHETRIPLQLPIRGTLWVS